MRYLWLCDNNPTSRPECFGPAAEASSPFWQRAPLVSIVRGPLAPPGGFPGRTQTPVKHHEAHGGLHHARRDAGPVDSFMSFLKGNLLPFGVQSGGSLLHPQFSSSSRDKPYVSLQTSLNSTRRGQQITMAAYFLSISFLISHPLWPLAGNPQPRQEGGYQPGSCST